ncbi:hypothetical protein J2Y45_006471 [Dyadobacter sp. BE34]|uniref:Uncharacterized protein n=1 Tax=Dyadobacter fermentans TaxID=94254 RepID=A0ABU1QZ24_9BACT|nr:MULTISPECIES: hypothetical protein [Dyadobacter]MDR6805929.1 hypothetical protein [Dyadobacter fermentans]MDR7042310.1 hypothetical protein [Dyadobacter sp. BE242]MDR7201308.1 hypothetical protein [Dyadobacter sp. BE34]MDR7215943.1 hypothetical protein [Dyadobacter sp. BE31]MDR7263479.1 hypothetical protein [Dyadobacter sp. BE32]
MKTFLAYLTFAALLALCYVEKLNAEEARSQARGDSGGHQVRAGGAARPDRHAAVAQLGE